MTGDPGTALLRAMLAVGAAPRLELVEMLSRDWASATFTGARHTIRLLADDDEGLAAWLDALPDAALLVRGHVVVDVAVTAVERRDGRAAVTLAALTVQG